MSEWKIVFIDPADGFNYKAEVYRPKNYKAIDNEAGSIFDSGNGTLSMLYAEDPNGIDGYEIWDLGFKKDLSATAIKYTLLVNGDGLEEVTKTEPDAIKTHPRRAKVTILSGGGSGDIGSSPTPTGSPKRKPNPKYHGMKVIAFIQVDVKKGLSKIKPRIPIFK